MTVRALRGGVGIAGPEAQENQTAPVTGFMDPPPQTLFNFRNIPPFEPSLPGLAVSSVKTFNGGSVADLDLEVEENAGAWNCELIFRTDLFEESTAARLLGHYVTLLESIARNPDELTGRLQLLTQNERAQILKDSRGPVRELPVLRIEDLISTQAAKTPRAMAVTTKGRAFTYGELERHA